MDRSRSGRNRKELVACGCQRLCHGRSTRLGGRSTRLRHRQSAEEAEGADAKRVDDLGEPVAGTDRICAGSSHAEQILQIYGSVWSEKLEEHTNIIRDC